MAEKKPPSSESNAKKTSVTRKRTRTTTKNKAAKMKTETELLEESFAALAPEGEALAARFYERLFVDYPQLTPLFEGISIKGQEKKLLASLVLLVQNLHNPDVLKDYLTALGARHVHYGVTAEHYPMVAETLLEVMAEFAGKLWTPAVKKAWTNTLSTVATIMLDAYEPMEADEMANKELEQQLNIMQSAVDGSSTALMMCDKDRIITYANPAVMSLLENRLTELHQVFPSLDLSKLLGTCIDDFHKDPSLQKGILSDLKNLPYNNQIQLLDIHFDLTATALLDGDGNYAGNMVEWKDITSEKAKETEVARLQSAVEGSSTALMMCDMDRVITYCNPSVVKLLENRLTQLRQIFPALDLNKIVGTCVDVFHKDPSHQAKLYLELDKMPYNNQIQLADMHFDLTLTAILDPDGKQMGNMVEWKDITEEKAKELEVARLQSAVEGASTALMMCDMDRVITYCNPAVVKLLENRLTQLRQIFPALDLNKIVGTCVDVFHKDPSHQAKLYLELDKMPYNNQIQLADMHFDLTLTAILGPDGKQMGNMVEWKDITDQVNAETAIQDLIKSAQVGELEQRIDASSYDGFAKGVAEGMNNVMDAVLAPMQETIRVAESLAAGDLTQNLDGSYQGMYSSLANALNDSVNKMSETVQEINETAGSIATASGEISEGNIDLSQRTEEQASSLEETASSMEELTSTVRQNSDNARQANQLASSSREQAEKGGSVIKDAINAMTAISASSKKVTDIIGVIDEIAFQTNLLALNAAVEAARAGEQGRGFAVVASEVRNLAQRSASAAKEIKELINDSGEKVKEGSMLVDESGRTLEEIVASSKKVGDIISEIAAAGAEQTQGIEQVNKAVTQMDEMTQQNAALVEQAAAASESLEEQGKGLQRLMSFFDTGEGSGNVPAPAAKAAPAPVAKSASKASKPAAPKSASKPAAPAASGDDEWDEF